MMKISDPILFGHAVSIFFDQVFEKHGDALAAGVLPDEAHGLAAQVGSGPHWRRARPLAEGSVRVVVRADSRFQHGDGADAPQYGESVQTPTPRHIHGGGGGRR